MADGHLGYVMPIGGVAAYRRAGLGRRRRVRHRVRQRRDPHRPARSHGTSGPRRSAAGRSPTRSRTSLVRRRAQEPCRRRAGRSSAVRERGVGRGCPATRARRRCARRRARSSARSAAATTTSTSSSTRPARSGSACTSAAAASVTPWRPASSRSRRTRKWGARVPEREVLLPLDPPIGARLLGADGARRRYAYAGREWVARKVVSILGGARAASSFTTTTTSRGARSTAAATSIVVRKGATPAFPGQHGFVGGSMGDDAVIVRGATRAEERRRGAPARRAVLDRPRRRPRDVANRRRPASGTGRPASAEARARSRRR